jgi:hypothetical protein
MGGALFLKEARRGKMEYKRKSTLSNHKQSHAYTQVLIERKGIEGSLSLSSPLFNFGLSLL